MFTAGQTVIYRREVCKIVEVARNYQDNEDYYVLTPLDNPALTIRLPISRTTDVLRTLITKADIDKLIQLIPDLDPVAIDSRNHASEYKDLLASGKHEDLIKIIKTTLLRQQDRTDQHQKINENDKNYHRTAERLLYAEIAATLGLTFDEARDFVTQKVSELITVKEDAKSELINS